MAQPPNIKFANLNPVAVEALGNIPLPGGRVDPSDIIAGGAMFMPGSRLYQPVCTIPNSKFLVVSMFIYVPSASFTVDSFDRCIFSFGPRGTDKRPPFFWMYRYSDAFDPNANGGTVAVDGDPNFIPLSDFPSNSSSWVWWNGQYFEFTEYKTDPVPSKNTQILLRAARGNRYGDFYAVMRDVNGNDVTLTSVLSPPRDTDSPAPFQTDKWQWLRFSVEADARLPFAGHEFSFPCQALDIAQQGQIGYKQVMMWMADFTLDFTSSGIVPLFADIDPTFGIQQPPAPVNTRFAVNQNIRYRQQNPNWNGDPKLLPYPNADQNFLTFGHDIFLPLALYFVFAVPDILLSYFVNPRAILPDTQLLPPSTVWTNLSPSHPFTQVNTPDSPILMFY